MTTLRQVESNRLNARQSTGPKSQEGKERARRNALKHGLAGDGVVLPDEEAEAVQDRFVEWGETLQPANACESWLAEQLALESIRFDTARRHDAALRTLQVGRATECWDDDRRASAEELGARLSRQPELVSRQLRQSAQGCAWLLERWRGLEQVIARGSAWTDPQRTLALDLLGTPRALRDLPLPTPLDPEPGQEPNAACLALAQREIALLADRKANLLDPVDQREQAAAEVGLGSEIPKPLSLVRRYAAECMRRFQWCWIQFQKQRNVQRMPANTIEPTDETQCAKPISQSSWREAVIAQVRRIRESAPPSPAPAVPDPRAVETIDVQIVPDPVPAPVAEPRVQATSPSGPPSILRGPRLSDPRRRQREAARARVLAELAEIQPKKK
jgi:hypothetical protein